MEENAKRINKPLLYHSVYIRSLHTYQDFLRKRPKTASHLKFSVIHETTDAKKIQQKLLNALHLFNSVTKVDLKEFRTTDHSSTFLAALKKASHVKRLLLFRPSKNLKESYFKYLPKLHHLNYGVNVQIWHEDPINESRYVQHPLRNLNYCPKNPLLTVYGCHSMGLFYKYFD